MRLLAREVRLPPSRRRGRGCPGGIRPVAGRAKRPSVPQTRSWVRDALRERAPERRRSTRRRCRCGRGRSRCSSSASRRGPRGSAARGGSLRGPAGRRSRARSSSPGAQALRDRRRRERRPELDRVEARAAPSRSAGCARGRRARACGRATRKGPVPSGARSRRPARRDDGRPRVGQERRERSEAGPRGGSRSRAPRRAAIPATLAGLPVEELRDAPDRDEGGRHLVRESRIERSSDALTAAAVSGAPSEKTTPGRSRSRTDARRRPRSVHCSQSAGTRFPCAIGRDERLEDVARGPPCSSMVW